jgi:hypothetical protein
MALMALTSKLLQYESNSILHSLNNKGGMLFNIRILLHGLGNNIIGTNVTIYFGTNIIT